MVECQRFVQAKSGITKICILHLRCAHEYVQVRYLHPNKNGSENFQCEKQLASQNELEQFLFNESHQLSPFPRHQKTHAFLQNVLYLPAPR